MIFTNYFLPVWFTPSMERGSLKPASFLLQPLPYKFLNYLPYFSQLPSENSSFYIEADDLAVQLSVIDAQNIDGYSHDLNLRSVLPAKMYNELITTIRDNYFLTAKDKQQIDYLAEFLTTERFQDESWTCEVCKKRKLDKQRNCPLLSEDEQKRYFDPKFRLNFNNEILTKCPVGVIDNVKASAVSEASSLYQKGILPEKGGMADQTIFFGYACQIMHHKIEARKSEMLNEQAKANNI